MLGAVQVDCGFTFHQIHEVVEVGRARVEVIAAIQPVQRGDDILRTGELIVENLGHFAGAGELPARNPVRIEVGVRHQLCTQTLPSTRSHRSSSGVPSRMCVLNRFGAWNSK